MKKLFLAICILFGMQGIYASAQAASLFLFEAVAGFEDGGPTLNPQPQGEEFLAVQFLVDASTPDTEPNSQTGVFINPIVSEVIVEIAPVAPPSTGGITVVQPETVLLDATISRIVTGNDAPIPVLSLNPGDITSIPTDSLSFSISEFGGPPVLNPPGGGSSSPNGGTVGIFLRDAGGTALFSDALPTSTGQLSAFLNSPSNVAFVPSVASLDVTLPDGRSFSAGIFSLSLTPVGPATPVPLPASAFFLLTALGGLVVARRARRPA